MDDPMPRRFRGGCTQPLSETHLVNDRRRGENNDKETMGERIAEGEGIAIEHGTHRRYLS